MPHSTHHTNLQQRHSHPSDPSGLSHLPSAAADLVLLGDLTGRYATGSYSRLASDGPSLVLRTDRQGAPEHGHRITAAIACHVARTGGTVDHLTQLLLHPDHEGGRHARNIALRSGQSRALEIVRPGACLGVTSPLSVKLLSCRALASIFRHRPLTELADPFAVCA
ncbi:hypothetical protein [Streptomyces hokutonensis]|uniref:Uncharacterized protein n=1 Tax=Streptomyces hokutonensis TaxID=1306990 RepID=A0ABW6MKW0_9ACTN